MTATTCGWRMWIRIEILGLVLDMTFGCCMHSDSQWVSPYREGTLIVLDHLESHTPAVQIAMGLYSAVAGRPLNMAYQTSAQQFDDVRS